ncbi:MAG: excinuclease ABC subunit UvrA [Candidatus Buchananbacteria bacterium]
MPDSIKIHGARVHNLKNISLEIPKNKLVVITGISGSGKSSLAFDTIYAEGQRRYAESLSAYARQFLDLLDKPDVDQIEGLSPTIAIDQRSVSHNPRSTVGTITEIYDYLRLLYAKIGTAHCPECNQKLERQTAEQILMRIADLPLGSSLKILAPIVRNQKGEHLTEIKQLAKVGYQQLRLDGIFYQAEELAENVIDKQKSHNLEVVLGSYVLTKNSGQDPMLKNLINVALDFTKGFVKVLVEPNQEYNFNQYLHCDNCHLDLPEIEPRTFSFNSPSGACAVCSGLGTKLEVDSDLVIPNKRLTLAEGAIKPWARNFSSQTSLWKLLIAVAKENNFSLEVPVTELGKKSLEIILQGTGDKKYLIDGENLIFEGVIKNLTTKYAETKSEYLQKEIEACMRTFTCPSCGGKRLSKLALAVTVENLNIAVLTAQSVQASLEFFTKLTKQMEKAGGATEKITRQLLKEIIKRLNYLDRVGLYYLTLDRTAGTLSGGEAQRVRLATQIGSGLEGVVYILDEPSIGLHSRDNDKLIDTLKKLKDLGNSVIVVEHDEAMMEAADYLIDIGPGAGRFGGEIIAQGTPAQVKKNKKSSTGQYLSGAKKIDSPAKRHKGNGKAIFIKGAKEFNLKNVDVKIPLGMLVGVTGVSGSGKSTLIIEILAKALAQKFYRAKDLPGQHQEIKGLENLDKVIIIDQSPIGRTPRSNPATYTGVFTHIRDLFTTLPEAKVRGFSQGHFSFNVKGGGRCEACAGEGQVRIGMQFLPDVYVACEECHGRRYNQQALEIHYQGKNIADVLEMSVTEAKDFFKDQSQIVDKLNILAEVGLGYLQLGQAATTLSGGEAQRVKLATELARRATGRTLYILDEPTTGLHFEDIKRLLQVLSRLVDKGNSILIIEHQLDVIKSCDWVIDLGPEGGERGGYVVAEGTPEQVVKSKKSYTAQYLKKVL